MALPQVLQEHIPLIEAFATAWMATGAKSYALVPPFELGESSVITAWPKPLEAVPARCLRVAIRYKGRSLVDICVDIAPTPENQQRLGEEARLIAHYAQLSATLEAMTRDFIQTQDQLVALYQLGESLRDTFVLDDILAKLTAEVLRLAQAGGAFIVVLIDGEPHFAYGGRALSNYIALELAERVFTTGQEHILSEHDAVYQNAALFPVRVRGRIAAVMGVYHHYGKDFASPDLKLLRALAEQAGIQIEKVIQHQAVIGQTKLRAELDVAADIQTRLLKIHLPRFDDVELFAYSRPAQQVGGDFYDLIADGCSFTFAVGDVTGKGMSAALLMAMSLAAFRMGVKSIQGPSPTALTQRLNEELYDNLTDVGMFITLFVGYYDSDNEVIRYANAGHSPVIYYPAKGEPRLLATQDIPIGVLPYHEFKECVIPLREGDVLVVATDGFSEAANPEGQLLGYQALLEIVKRHTGRSALSMANALYSAVEQFSADTIQTDDQTLFIIKRMKR